MIVIKTSIFPASKEEVFNKLQKLKLLQYIAWPYVTFTPVGEKISVWRAGTSSAYKFKQWPGETKYLSFLQDKYD